MTAYDVRISDWSSDVCSSDLESRVGRVFMKNKLLAGAMALALIGCSERRADAAMSDEAPAMAEVAADAAGRPDVAATAAPGVAFHYAYPFRPHVHPITGGQSTHPAPCQTLAPAPRPPHH